MLPNVTILSLAFMHRDKKRECVFRELRVNKYAAIERHSLQIFLCYYIFLTVHPYFGTGVPLLYTGYNVVIETIGLCFLPGPHFWVSYISVMPQNAICWQDSPSRYPKWNLRGTSQMREPLLLFVRGGLGSDFIWCIWSCLCSLYVYKVLG